jgi:nitrous-oxide reductase
MKLLLDFPTIGEPHYAHALPASMIRDKQIKFFSLKDNANPFVARAESETGIQRNGKRIDVKLIAIRSHFAPDNINGVQQGDTVFFHVTNIEQDWDILHGFAVLGAENAELIMQPGETRTLKWIPKNPGIYPFYCTDFCSALHQEMQGYIRVAARGTAVAVSATTSPKAQSQIARLQSIHADHHGDHK